MNIEVSFRVEKRILKCYISGSRNPEHMCQYWQEILNKCRKEKLNRIFITMALQGTFNRFEALQAFQSVISTLQFSNIAIALTDLNEHSSADCKMACHMAAAKNIIVAYVESESDAIEWLNSQGLLTSKSSLSQSSVLSPPV